MVYDSTKRKCHTPSAQATILKVSTAHRKNKSGRWARITLSAGNFFSQLGQGVSVPDAQSKDSKILVWAPIEYIPAQLFEVTTSTASIPELSHQNDDLLAVQHPLENTGASTSQLSSLDSSLLSLVDQIPVEPVSDLSEVLKKRRTEKRKANRLAKKRKDNAAAFEHALEQVAEISHDKLDRNGTTSSAPQKRKFSEAFPHDSEVIIVSD